MATIKSFTDLTQSKALAEFLPIESADMCFNISQRSNMPPLMTPYSKFNEFFNMETPDFLIPCWSLAALFNILPKIQGGKPIIALDDNYIAYPLPHRSDLHTKADNLVDACVEMILKLHEQKLL